ncbi:hypothetical protein BJF78_10090 [Pseudonocardia sp. CNS-139]|nr:hypothetical protein BJF78_10090 [Pseudonocardia sp. CNS-139]
MRRAYVHEATVTMDPGGDERAPGAAVTVALCGHWDHAPPCPLAAHHTAATRDGADVRLRVLFAAEPADEAEVRARIGDALAARWRLRSSGPAVLREDEADHAERLVSG